MRNENVKKKENTKATDVLNGRIIVRIVLKAHVEINSSEDFPY